MVVRTKNVTLPLVMFCLLFVSSQSYAQVSEQLLNRANSLFESYQERQALRLYEEVLKKDADNHEALWKASFLSARVGNRISNEEVQEKHFFKAMDYAEKALSEEPNKVESYYAMCVALGRMAIISDAKNRVAVTRKVEKMFNKGLSIEPDHPGLLHVKGYLKYRLANASAIETMAGNVLFGGLPEATNQEAIDILKRAVTNRPDYLLYQYDLGQAYMAAGRETDAKEMFQQVVNAKSLTPDDPQIKSDARAKLAELKS